MLPAEMARTGIGVTGLPWSYQRAAAKCTLQTPNVGNRFSLEVVIKI
ncbi:hypothetical protein AOX55_00001732 [Sinorhizobium fredii CCBAU 25509]|nr:hypothetical protein AOX55_00001732 [Sinorhizobium fredii CCBAU 25509]